jgi:murein hydrolase activator
LPVVSVSGFPGQPLRLPLLLLLISLILLTWSSVDAQTDPSESTEIELESVRTRIKDVQTKLNEARKDVDSYLTDLQQSEMSATEIATSLQSLAEAVQQKLITLEQLRVESTTQEHSLVTERQLLAEQVRMAYKTGRHDFLKLFLNQEDPALIGRMMTYHDYYNQARTKRIAEVRMTLQNLQLLRSRIDQETVELQQLRDQQLDRLQQLDTYRESRSTIIASLQDYISGQDKQLQNLQRDELELSDLLNNLETQESVVQLYEELPPFDKMKGKLNWPVRGKLITHFGSEKKEGKLRWNGVRIAAAAGTAVQAISPGKVIFADWFRNLGLLIIIDHGSGYMSLYGHNESLAKKAGDFVNTGDQIANVGDTGGQTETALYFEIRQQGTPLNPDLWCRG